MNPDDLLYTSEHEWVRSGASSASSSEGSEGSASGSTVRVGITDYAQDALGDIVYVSLPEVGTEIEGGSPVGELESTKSVSDVYAPLSGSVTAVNEALDGTPELVNSDPYGEGWLFEMEPSDASSVDGLMDASAYQATVGS